MLDNEIVGRMKDNVSVCYIFIVSGQFSDICYCSSLNFLLDIFGECKVIM